MQDRLGQASHFGQGFISRAQKLEINRLHKSLFPCLPRHDTPIYREARLHNAWRFLLIVRISMLLALRLDIALMSRQRLKTREVYSLF